MIKVFCLMGNKIINITPLCKSISISGDISSVARKLDVTIANSIYDTNQPKVNITVGTKMWVTLNEKEIFRGIVWDRGISGGTELTLTVYDFLIYLTKSKVTYNFQNITCNEATQKICSEFGVATGYLAPTGRYSRIIKGKTGYNAIMEMYTQDSLATKKQYIPVMDGLKLNVIEKGALVQSFSLVLQPNNSNISSVSYNDSLDSMVNRVKIYNENGNYIGTAQNEERVKLYGVLQENYTKETDKNANTVANNMLTGVTQSISVEALGNWNCRTGYAVKTSIFYLDSLKNVVMYIDSDTHTFDVGTNKHTMSLNLSFKNLMDSKGEED